MQKTISMDDLLADPERIAREIETAGTVYRIRRPGRKRLLLVDKRYIESLEATVEFVTLHPNFREELAQLDRDIADGHLYELVDVLKELGLDAPANESASKGRTRKRSRRRSANARSRASRTRSSTAQRRSPAR